MPKMRAADDERLERMFAKADLDKDGAIDVNELFHYGWPKQSSPLALPTAAAMPGSRRRAAQKKAEVRAA
jgi:hypothetical protein